jgi:hypothetical protein
MAYLKHVDAYGAVIEYRDNSRFAYGEAVEGGRLEEISEAEYLASVPGESERRAAAEKAAALIRLEEIDKASIRALREAASGDARLAALEKEAQGLRLKVTAVASGGASGGISVKVKS